jgi:apolipoprotein N-acyltransferase
MLRALEKATSLVNICPPGELILNPSLDSWYGMQSCSMNFLLMKVYEAPESKRIIAG